MDNRFCDQKNIRLEDVLDPVTAERREYRPKFGTFSTVLALIRKASLAPSTSHSKP